MTARACRSGGGGAFQHIAMCVHAAAAAALSMSCISGVLPDVLRLSTLIRSLDSRPLYILRRMGRVDGLSGLLG